MSMAHAAERTPAPLVTDEHLGRELRFAEDYQIAKCDRWIHSLLASISPAEHSTLQDKLRVSLVLRLTPYHAWHDKVPFVTLQGLNRGGIPLGEQFTDHAPVTLGTELEHVLVYGPTGSGKSHLLAKLIAAILETE